MFSSIVPLYYASVWIVQILFNYVILDALIRNVPSIHAFGEALSGALGEKPIETGENIDSGICIHAVRHIHSCHGVQFT